MLSLSPRNWNLHSTTFENWFQAPVCTKPGRRTVAVGGAKTPSEHRWGTLEQGIDPPNAHRDELATHSGVHLPSHICSWDRLQHLPQEPEKEVEIKKISVYKGCFIWNLNMLFVHLEITRTRTQNCTVRQQMLPTLTVYMVPLWKCGYVQRDFKAASQ